MTMVSASIAFAEALSQDRVEESEGEQSGDRKVFECGSFDKELSDANAISVC